jgi:hypothetical protein
MVTLQEVRQGKRDGPLLAQPSPLILKDLTLLPSPLAHCGNVGGERWKHKW